MGAQILSAAAPSASGSVMIRPLGSSVRGAKLAMFRAYLEQSTDSSPGCPARAAPRTEPKAIRKARIWRARTAGTLPSPTSASESEGVFPVGVPLKPGGRNGGLRRLANPQH